MVCADKEELLLIKDSGCGSSKPSHPFSSRPFGVIYLVADWLLGHFFAVVLTSLAMTS